MKVSELWLHEWVKPNLSREQLCEMMTMSGLEIESIDPVSQPFMQVVVGQILNIIKHPDADKLNVCEVDVGIAKPLTIVCGAKNVEVGIKIPVALEGAVLANDFKITINQIRGVTSYGMLCSAKELNLAEQSDGLLIFPKDAKVGVNVWEYLQLSDFIIDVSITPNRGDCLSIKGLANEVSALTKTKITVPTISQTSSKISDVIPVTLSTPQACSHYVGRIIKEVNVNVITPIWMQERLRRVGTRCINPVVDVMNYVMYELGQPMHAFDLNKISDAINVRMAKSTETIELLDGQTVTLTPEILVIADKHNPLAIAGVMGGLDSSVTAMTKDVFLESAYFNPESIARAGRHFNIGSESSYRFERGVDPTLQILAIERATQLLVEIVGGNPGPIIDTTDKAYIPKPLTILLRKNKITSVLGMVIPDKDVEDILMRLGFECKTIQEGWEVKVPSTRSDVTIEVDLIEEVIRVYGINKIPIRDSFAAMHILPEREKILSLNQLRNALRNLGYHEVLTYSFVDAKLQQMLNPEFEPKPLRNPITSDMSMMRTNLWPGLLKTCMYNLNRQQTRIRIFETGLRFVPDQQTYLQQRVLSGLVLGSVLPEQWGSKTEQVDFFDVKGDLQNLFNQTAAGEKFLFKKAFHHALHPGQTAEIYRNDKCIGLMGALHPSIAQSLDLTDQLFLFELLLDDVQEACIPHYKEVSKFPEIRRDIAIFVDRSVPVQLIQDTIVKAGGELVKSVKLFDVYQGQNVVQDRKSLALSLTLQHSSRTLVDEEVTKVIERVIVDLKEQFAAELRG